MVEFTDAFRERMRRKLARYGEMARQRTTECRVVRRLILSGVEP